MASSCFGAYENEGECGTCPLSLACIEATISNDGYYDSLAEKEASLWEELEQAATDAAILDAWL